jgi:hypothetical protein
MNDAQRNTPATEIYQSALQNATLAEAQQQLGVEDLPGLLAENPALSAAWERGRFLRRLGELASTPICETAAAQALGLTEQEFRTVLASDPESADIWKQGKHVLLLRVQGAVLRGAEEGKTHCLRTLECLLRIQTGVNKEGVDFNHLTSTELEAATGIHRQQILRWYKSQGLPRNTDGTYALPAVITWLRQLATKKTRMRKSTEPGHTAARIIERISGIIQEELSIDEVYREDGTRTGTSR